MIRLVIAISLLLLPSLIRAADSTQEERALIAKAMLEEDAQTQASQISALAGKASPAMLELLQQWKEGVIYIYTDEDGAKIPVIPVGEKDADDKQLAKKFVDNTPLNDAQGAPLKVGSTDIETADTSSTLRVAMKTVTDMAALVEPDIKKRIQAIQNLGIQQDPEKLPALQAALKTETDSDAKHALEEAIAFVELRSEDAVVKLAACRKLGELDSIPSQDVLKTLKAEAEAAGNTELAAAAQASLDQIASHVKTVNTVGTMFRGLSTGSVLLVVAIGLAITFGLMGVINMAHGEMMVIGAYTTYLVQKIFGDGLGMSPFGIPVRVPGMHTTGWVYDCYFIVALPAAFCVAALVGIALERSIIRFLYKRPLESLLATWGVSLVLQQGFRLIFGSNNVDVSRPSWLAGNWIVNDVQFMWNRVFVITFAVIIVFLT